MLLRDWLMSQSRSEGWIRSCSGQCLTILSLWVKDPKVLCLWEFFFFVHVQVNSYLENSSHVTVNHPGQVLKVETDVGSWCLEHNLFKRDILSSQNVPHQVIIIGHWASAFLSAIWRYISFTQTFVSSTKHWPGPNLQIQGVLWGCSLVVHLHYSLK